MLAFGTLNPKGALAFAERPLDKHRNLIPATQARVQGLGFRALGLGRYIAFTCPDRFVSLN